MKLKYCSKCKLDIDINLFYKSSKRVDGLQNNCKSCNKSNVNKWQENNRELIKSSINVEKRKEDSKKWYQENKQKHKENVMSYNKLKYHTDPYYRILKDYYHLLYEYNKKCELTKSENTFKMIGTNSEEIKQYFKSSIDIYFEQNIKTTLQNIIPAKFFVKNTPIDIVYGLLNLNIVPRNRNQPEKILITSILFITVQDYIKDQYLSKLIVKDFVF